MILARPPPTSRDSGSQSAALRRQPRPEGRFQSCPTSNDLKPEYSHGRHSAHAIPVPLKSSSGPMTPVLPASRSRFRVIGGRAKAQGHRFSEGGCVDASWGAVCRTVADRSSGDPRDGGDTSEPDALTALATYGPWECGPPPSQLVQTMRTLWQTAASPERSLEQLLVLGATQPRRPRRLVGPVGAGRTSAVPAAQAGHRGVGELAVEPAGDGRAPAVHGLARPRDAAVRPVPYRSAVRRSVQLVRGQVGGLTAGESRAGTAPVRPAPHVRRVGPPDFARLLPATGGRTHGAGERTGSSRQRLSTRHVGEGRRRGATLRRVCAAVRVRRRIRPPNRCQRCERSDGVANPRRWWLWFNGERHEYACRECHPCRRYFFHHTGACPNGHGHWSKRDFVVLVRAGTLPMEAADWRPDPEPGPRGGEQPVRPHHAVGRAGSPPIH